MVFRLDTQLTAQTLAQKPGSNPTWVNPILLAQEKQKTNNEAGLALAGIVGNATTEDTSVALKMNEMNRVGERAIAETVANRQAAAAKAANDRVMADTAFNYNMTLKAQEAAAALTLSKTESAADYELEKYKQDQESKRAGVENALKWITEKGKIYAENYRARLAAKTSAENSERMARTQFGSTILYSVPGVLEGTKGQAELHAKNADTYSASAEKYSLAASAYHAAATSSALGGYMQQVGPKGYVPPTRDEMASEWMGLTQSPAPVDWDDSTLAANLAVRYRDMVDNERNTAEATLKQGTAAALKLIQSATQSAGVEEDGEARKGLVDSLFGLAELFSSNDPDGSRRARARAAAMEADRNRANAWMNNLPLVPK